MQVKITATASSGGTLATLNALIKKRTKALKEDASRSVIATAINVLVSLRADTRKSPVRGRKEMYTLSLTNYAAGWEKIGKSFHRVVRASPRGPVLREITSRCRNVVGRRYHRGEVVHVYRADIKNEAMKVKHYFAFAKDEKQVRKYIETVILPRLLKKESGMARYTLGVAAAKVSNKPMNTPAPTGAKQMRIAHAAGMVKIDASAWNVGSVNFSFLDDLKYSTAALKHGSNSLNLAMMKAANKTAGLIRRAYLNKRFGEDCPTPFPEISKRSLKK